MIQSPIENLEALDKALVVKHWPPISPWWHRTFADWWKTDKPQLVVRAGRRGGKSSSLSRFAVAFALAYDWRSIPPGDLGCVAFISVSRDEAAQRLRTIKAILDTLKIKWKPIEGGIEMTSRPIAFKVFTATIAGVSGFTSILVIADEVSKWRDAETDANPAIEVLASVRPTMATQKSARIVLSSSPMSVDDAHAKAFSEGPTAIQEVAYAETWIANPTISEKRTRLLEPNERVWRREYAAIPQASLTSTFDPDTIDRAMQLWGELQAQEGSVPGSPVMAIDASRGGDAWTWAISRYMWMNGKDRLKMLEIGTVPDATDSRKAVSWLSAKCKREGIYAVLADQYEAGSLQVLFADQGIGFYEMKWTGPSKRSAVDRVDRMLRDDALLLPKHPTLRKQLNEYSERITRSGEITYGGRGRNDDHAAVVLTTILGDIHRRILHAEGPAPSAIKKTIDQVNKEWESRQEELALTKAKIARLEKEDGIYGDDT